MNRLAAAVIMLSFAVQPPAPPPADTRELPDAVPREAKVEHFTVSPDAQRTYFVNTDGEAWVYDRGRKTSTRIAAGPLWDLNLAASADAIAYVKSGGRRGSRYVWMLPLNPATGLAAGAERQLSSQEGDVPSMAPDGKSVAFARDDANGVGQSVVVVPIGGGAERVVAEAIGSSLANIRWTPDGRTLYIGVNPPVACVPEWSCLPLARDSRQPPGTIRRAAVSGGALTIMVAARGVEPGLSPDGATLMYPENAARRWVVANADGTRRDTVTLSAGQSIAGWLRGSTLLIGSGGSVRRLRTIGIADGQSQIVEDAADSLTDPSWSPDGRLMTVFSRAGSEVELRVLNADGSGRRALPVPENFATATAWSPDGRWIAYAGFSENLPPHIAAIEVATGRHVNLHEFGDRSFMSIRWQPDSRAIVSAETFDASDSDRNAKFRRVDLAGAVTTLGELVVGPSPSSAAVIDGASALLTSNVGGHRVVSLAGGALERMVLPSFGGDSPLPSLSADAQWVTGRHAGTTGGQHANVLEIVRVDGASRKTIAVPFAAGSSPRVIPGANALIVTEARRPDDTGVYVVPTGTDAVRKLFTFSSASGPPELSVSPDGRTLLFLAWENAPSTVRTLDVSARH